MKEIILPLGLALIIGSMLVPVPPGIIDLLLVGNLFFALLLFASAVHIIEPVKLSALPVLLLFATLLRLALNISTTRLILSQGNAGEMVAAFGNVVVQGNILVGVVIFLVISLVQFIVIAKGAERVAEVSARFTLDALPGKQMSIDADVRAGLIDLSMARQKREELQLESRFHGALDGAMKFVKGDAIAGLCITAINLLGGLTLGFLVHELSFTEAVSRYSMLSIGDGLLSQIPALLNALAAGLVVTRVVRSEKTSMSHDILSQLGGEALPRVFAALLLFALAFAPGLPAFPFLVSATGVFLTLLFHGKNAQNQNVTEQLKFQPEQSFLLRVCLSKNFAQLNKEGTLQEAFCHFQKHAFQEYGFLLEVPQLEIDNESEGRIRIFMRDIPVVELEAVPEEDLSEKIEKELENLLRVRRAEFVDDIHTRRILDFLDGSAPELLSTVVPGVIQVTQLSTLLRKLVEEKVSIRSIELVLQAVSETGAKAESEEELLMHVRRTLGRGICYRVSDGKVLRAYSLEAELDFGLRRDDELFRQCASLLLETLQKENLNGSVLVTSGQTRRIAFEICREMGIELTVLAHEEIPADVTFESLGTIAFPEKEQHEILEQLAA